MNMKQVKSFIMCFSSILMLTSSLFASEKTKAQIQVEQMGIGINLGNTFEATDSSLGTPPTGWQLKTVREFETAWGSPVITESMIKGYVASGFQTLRIPVAWSNMMSEDGNYQINQEFLNRVKSVIDIALAQNMYVIMNEHWDYGWIETEMISNKPEAMKKYRAIWTQLAEAFKNYDNHLIFESQNEELGNFKKADGNSVWNSYNPSDTTNKKTVYTLANEINQVFVDIIRNSGGNNKERLLLISGINTDIAKTCDPLFVMPNDPASMCAVSVHYYTPADFAIIEEDTSWAKNRSTWGTPKDTSELASNLKKMKTTFVDAGIPVIIGEYGCPTKNKDKTSVEFFLKSVCSQSYKLGMCPVLWDIQRSGTEKDPFSHYNRRNCKLVNPVVENNFKEILKTGR